MNFRIVKADERHRAEIDRLIKETRIGEGDEADRPVRYFWLAKIGNRVEPPECIASFPDFTSKRYMKCAVMLNDKL